MTTTYEYQWEDSTPALRVIRTPAKGFYQQRYVDGEWVDGVGDMQRPLYRLPELAAANSSVPVLIVEGEKDTDNARSKGFVATTNPGGAGGFQQHMTKWVTDRKVVIIADNDEAGRTGAIRKALMLQSTARSVVMIECLNGVEEIKGGDLSDWFELGHTAVELVELVKQLPEWEPPAPVITERPQVKERGGFGLSLFDRVKAAVRVEDVAERLTELTGLGNVLTGACPLHEGSGKEFVIWTDIQEWKCYGRCQTGGDLIDLVAQCMDRQLEWRKPK